MSPVIVSYVLDPLERSGRTFAQQFLVALLATGSVGMLIQQNWLIAADSAGFAAAVSILTSVLTFKVPVLPAWADLALRVVKTALQSFVGTLIAANILSVAHADWRGALALALPVAGTALLTGLAAWGIPTTSGASLLPAGIAVAVVGPVDDTVVMNATVDPNAEYIPAPPKDTVPPFIGPGPNADPS